MSPFRPIIFDQSTTQSTFRDSIMSNMDCEAALSTHQSTNTEICKAETTLHASTQTQIASLVINSVTNSAINLTLTHSIHSPLLNQGCLLCLSLHSETDKYQSLNRNILVSLPHKALLQYLAMFTFPYIIHLQVFFLPTVRSFSWSNTENHTTIHKDLIQCSPESLFEEITASNI